MDPGVGTERKGIAVKTQKGNTFIGPDNGVLSHVYQQQGIASAHVLEEKSYFLGNEISKTFHGRDIFGPVAAHVAKGVEVSSLGPKSEKLIQLDLPVSKKVDNRVKGEVVYIDHYGNVITNIKREDMQSTEYGLLLKTKIGSRRTSIPYVETYGKGPKGRVFCLINSEGDFELAVKNGSAAKTLKLKVGSVVDVQL